MENKRVRDLKKGDIFSISGMSGNYKVHSMTDAVFVCKGCYKINDDIFGISSHHIMQLGRNSLQFIRLVRSGNLFSDDEKLVFVK